MAVHNKYRPKVTPEMAQGIKDMRAAGALQKDIAAHYGLTVLTVQLVLNPDLAERRRKYKNDYYKDLRKHARHEHVQSQAELEAEWRKQLPHIPTPKTLNQILLGDPCEGRSALDQRQNA